MPKRDLPREFQTLVAFARKTNWLLRSLAVSSEEQRLHGVCAGRMRFGTTLMPMRSAMWIGFKPLAPSAEPPFRRLARKLGFVRHFKTAWYARPWQEPLEGLEAEASRVLRACRAGKVEPADRRPIAPDKLRRPKVHVLEQKRGWGLVEWLAPRMTQGWRAQMLFLRQEKRVRAEGVDWIVDCDGYWEPSDRKGLEIDLILMSARPMSIDVWKRLQSTGFYERLTGHVKRFGLRPELRPRLGSEDFDGTSGGQYLATFGRKIPRVEDAARLVPPMLKWAPT